MILLLPLISVTLVVRWGAAALVQCGRKWAMQWASWSSAAATGMATVFVCTGITHFVEPQRSGFEAIIPDFVPQPAMVVTLSGVAELILAVTLVIPRTRLVAALAAVLFLLAVFPANVIAAAGVSHPAAPNTPLVPRTLLQLMFIGCAATPLLRRLAGPDRNL